MAAGLGVAVEDLRAAVSAGDAGGVVWPFETWARIWSRLTPLQQSVVYWHVLGGHGHRDVAELLGVGRGSVYGAWRRARARIRCAVPDPGPAAVPGDATAGT